MSEIDWGLVARMLKSKRKFRRQGVREAAKEIGVSPATVSRTERGLPSSADNLVRICAWLEQSLDGMVRP